jgi:hypothetical protein
MKTLTERERLAVYEPAIRRATKSDASPLSTILAWSLIAVGTGLLWAALVYLLSGSFDLAVVVGAVVLVFILPALIFFAIGR